MKTFAFPPSLSLFFSSLLLFFLFLLPSPSQELPQDLAHFSLFEKVDLNDLAQGKILTQSGSPMKFKRGLSVQTLIFLPIPPSQIKQLLQQWNPTSHPELGVSHHLSLSLPPSSSDFSHLEKFPHSTHLEALKKMTQHLAGNTFNLSEKEQALGEKKWGQQALQTRPLSFWAEILSSRASLFFTQGVYSLPSYQKQNKLINVSQEAKALLVQNKKVLQQFRSLLASAIFAQQPEAYPSYDKTPYWELLDIQGIGTFNLGVLYSHPTSTGWQAVDFQYYFSGSIYTSLILYQAWPLTLHHQSGTLLWRNDLLSSPLFHHSTGVEHLATNMMMVQAVKKSLHAFYQDAMNLSQQDTLTSSAKKKASIHPDLSPTSVILR